MERDTYQSLLELNLYSKNFSQKIQWWSQNQSQQYLQKVYIYIESQFDLPIIHSHIKFLSFLGNYLSSGYVYENNSEIYPLISLKS